MNETIITKEFEFDAAHRLMHYEGACHNIHGHTWKVEFGFTGLINNKSGMLIDFSELKHVLQEYLVSQVDHAILLNKDDDTLLEFCNEFGFKVFEVDGDPTCENLVEAFVVIVTWLCMSTPLLKNIKPVAIRLWESKTSSIGRRIEE